MALGPTITQPTRFPGGITNVPNQSPLRLLEGMSPYHDLVMGWGYNFGEPTMPTGNTPATNFGWTVTAVTSTGTASFAAAAVFPPRHLLTTGTTSSDQVVMTTARSIKQNLLSLRKVMVFGTFKITSTVANSKTAFGLFSGTSLAALGNDEFCFNSSGATLNFLCKNNGGTTLTTAVSTAITINTVYGVAAILNPAASTVALYFGTVDSLDLRLSSQTPNELPLIASAVAVSSSNIVDGTNAVKFGFGAQTSSGAAATVEFGPCMAALM